MPAGGLILGHALAATTAANGDVRGLCGGGPRGGECSVQGCSGREAAVDRCPRSEILGSLGSQNSATGFDLDATAVSREARKLVPSPSRVAAGRLPGFLAMP